MKIKLSQKETELLKEAIKHCKGNFPIKVVDGVLILTEDNATDLREYCSDYLLYTGFDKDYNPNSGGKILEALIDKFYIK